MSVTVTLNGVQYLVPAQGDIYPWAAGQGGVLGVTGLLQGIAAGTLQPTGGSFPLGADVDFGGSFGLKNIGYLDLSATAPALSGSGRARLKTVGGVVYASENAGSYYPLSNFVNVQSFGAKGDGVTDDTTAVQAALNFAAANTRTVWFPAGTYLITSQLNFSTTQVAYAARFAGPGGASFQRTGAALKWGGSSGGTLFRIQGGNNCVVENLGFDGNYLAAKLLWIDSANLAGSTAVSSSGVHVQHCTFYNSLTNTGVDLTIGSSLQPGSQASEVSVHHCVFNSETGKHDACIRMLSGGNCKNFRLRDNAYLNANYGIDWGSASGFMVVEGCAWEQIYTACIQSTTGNLLVLGGGVEDGTTTSSGTTNPAGGLFLQSGAKGSFGSPSQNAFVAVVMGVNFSASLASDDIGIMYRGQLVLRGNTFWNQRGLDVPATHEFGVYVDGAADGVSQYGSCTSEANFYQNTTVGSYAPLYHYSVGYNFLNPGSSHVHRYAVRSWGDFGGASGAIGNLISRDARDIKATATWDPASIADGAATSTAVTVQDANLGDLVSVSFSNAVPALATLTAQVTAANTVAVTLFNKTGGNLDLASGTLTITCKTV